ncbi:hypothetical protein [Mycobacteroides chelonae]|uniref:hypothetical protein n=1 Tax=Mycobacteroides chelonae TaxID=1774 RepID=UPI0013F4F2B3|nr:hypothetical protein [Mycobacteroides chelonae]QQG89991.1 hypothetical protein HBA99_24400 [Mycobacteroides chelonae]QQG94809.1 hypothetical protein HBA97_24400 [Mycobacteroides chelonae]
MTVNLEAHGRNQRHSALLHSALILTDGAAIAAILMKTSALHAEVFVYDSR